jgi:hypothetical protein
MRYRPLAYLSALFDALPASGLLERVVLPALPLWESTTSLAKSVRGQRRTRKREAASEKNHPSPFPPFVALRHKWLARRAGSPLPQGERGFIVRLCRETYPRLAKRGYTLHHLVRLRGALMRRHGEAGRGAAPAGFVATKHSGGIGAPPGTTMSPCQELADRPAASSRKARRLFGPDDARLMPATESEARCRTGRGDAEIGAPRGARVPQGTSYRLALFGAPSPSGAVL